MSLVKFSNDALPGFSGLLENFFGRDIHDTANRFFSGSSLPAVNIKETKEDFLVEVAAPGMKKDDFKVTLENNLLTISSEKQHEYETHNEQGKYTRREFSYQAFRRSFAVPDNIVDANNIGAKYNDGVLSIQIPKKEEAKQKSPRTIEIS